MVCTYKITKDLNTNNKFTVWWTKIHHTWARNKRQGSSNKRLERGLPRSKCPLQTRRPRMGPSPEKGLGGKTTCRESLLLPQDDWEKRWREHFYDQLEWKQRYDKWQRMLILTLSQDTGREYSAGKVLMKDWLLSKFQEISHTPKRGSSHRTTRYWTFASDDLGNRQALRILCLCKFQEKHLQIETVPYSCINHGVQQWSISCQIFKWEYTCKH